MEKEQKAIDVNKQIELTQIIMYKAKTVREQLEAISELAILNNWYKPTKTIKTIVIKTVKRK